MSRVQLALNVSDLDAAVDFYSKLFATEPAKRRPGYANFAIAEPPLKLVLIEGTGAARHPQPPRASRSRPPTRWRPPPPGCRARAWPPPPRTRSSCCFAVQDKVWVDAPDGEPWEIYTVLADVEMPAGAAAHRRRRATTPCAAAVGARVRRPLLLSATATSPAGPLAEALGTGLLVVAVVGLGHRRPAAVARRRRAPAAGELHRHRRRPGRAHPRLRAGVGRPLQPGRDPGRPRPRRARPPSRRAPTSPPRSPAACVGADRRQPHVRPARRRAVHPRPRRRAGCGWARWWPPSACSS